MNERVEHYYLRKPEITGSERTSRFIACHIKFGGDSGMGKPMWIWVVDSHGNEEYLPLIKLGNDYDAWLISDLLLGHMKKVTVKQYINARVKAMKGEKA